MYRLDDKYKSGIDTIDQQHQQLMDLIHLLKTDTEISQNPGKFLESLVEINELAQEHFNVEEELLEQAGYDKLDNHVSQHDRILYDLNDLILSCMNGELSASTYSELIQLLTDWFEKHVLQEDAEFFSDVLNKKKHT